MYREAELMRRRCDCVCVCAKDGEGGEQARAIRCVSKKMSVCRDQMNSAVCVRERENG